MPQEIKQLYGALNLDDPSEVIAKNFHRDSRNIWFKGLPPNRRIEYIPGNVVIPNVLIPNVGINKTILEKYDPVNKCIYYFNYNSAGSHGIYKFNTIPQTFQRLVEVGINTNGDILGFTGESLHNIDIIYGDSQQGDILYWIDSLGRPSKININRALSSGYGTIERSYLDVAKEPADIVPSVVYENDPANTVNNCRKKLFRVKIRWVFDDNDKSVTSSQSVMPIPFDAFDQTVDADPTFNCRLAITYQTGPPNVKKVEIYVSNSLGNQMSNFYLVASLDKSVQGINDNDVATYLFYNDKGYTDLNTTESDQLFDYVPKATFAQAVPNGNVLDYGNITEGFPNLTNFSDGTNTSTISSGQTPYYYGNYFGALVANQDGMSGFGTGNIHIVVRGIIVSTAFFTRDTYTVYFTDSTNISYAVQVGDDASSVIEGLRVDAIAKGFNIISNGNNDLVIFKTGTSLARSFISNGNTYNSINLTSFNAYDWSSKYGFGLVYFDKKGRTNGVVYTNGFSVQSAVYTEGTPPNDIPIFNASIYHQPPDWSYYYQWVRTKNLSKQSFVQWITDRTFKDTTSVSGQTKYAYLSIESLNAFVANNPGSPLGYGFTAGDRVRFYKRYNEDGSTAFLYYNTKDFEIVASLVNPTINGEVKTGQFIKIILPATSGDFDFGNGFDNYFIELYTPAQPVANNLNVYFEFGERYAVGNPTESNRFHQGMLQNQIYLSQPATFDFFKGDDYIRIRSIQTGNVYSYNVLNGGTGSSIDTILIGLNFQSSTYNNSDVTAQSCPYVALTGSFNSGTDTRWFLRSTPGLNTFKVQGSITLTFTGANSGDSWRIYHENRFGEQFNIVDAFDASEAATHTFTINSTITLEDDRIFLIAASNVSRARTITFAATNLTYTIDHVITQRCIDPNFSDYFQSTVNSNGRAFLFDENANEVTFPTMHRWSLPYQEDTNINQTNRFYAENFDTVNRSYGAIMAMKVWQQRLTFFQERKCGQTGIFQKYITDNDGDTSLITTQSIITKNNVQYYNGDFGVGNLPMSIVQDGFVYYYVDPIKGKIIRLSNDGNIDLTEKYKTQTWGSQNLPKYLNPGDYVYGGKQKVLGTFNIRQDNVGEYLLLAQGTEDEPGEVFGFEEAYNSFYSKIDIDCDSIVCAENVLYYFKAGLLYKQSTSAAYNNFFGTQYEAFVTLVFNDNVVVKKLFDGIGYMSNKVWNSDEQGDVETNSINSQTSLLQQSLIMSQDYTSLEAPKQYAAFNFDMNSNSDPIVGLWEGDKLNGEFIICKLKLSSADFTYLYAPFINWQIDNRNP